MMHTMNDLPPSHPASVKMLVFLEILFGILGTISGILLMADPSGALLGFSSDIIEKIPFQSFFPVGLFLFLIYGILPIVLGIYSWTGNELFFKEISKAGGIHWTWQAAMGIIAVLVIWLIVEGALIGLDFPPTYFTVLIGAAIFVTLVLPSTRKYFAVKN